ncbi:phage neck terminator protein [Achromobacter aegrifaciens]
MSVQISITESQLVEDLVAFFRTLVDCEVVRGLPNWVPTPARECIVITPLAALGLSLPAMTYADPSPAAGTRTMTQATQWSARVEGYGVRAQDLALTLSIALRSQYGCEFLGSLGRVQPLYTGELKQLPFESAESLTFERWSFDAVLQFNPSITVPQQFADQLHVGLIEVDTTFPPGA